MTFTIDMAVAITVLIAILGLAAAWGALGQKVRQHSQDIKDQKVDHDCDIERVHRENREDHQLIFKQLNDLNEYLRGGRTHEHKAD